MKVIEEKDGIKVMHISAKEGDPSTFWQGASGSWYRTKAEAQTDDKTKALDPSKYEINVSFWDKNKKVIIGFAVVAVIAVAVWYFKFRKK